MSLVGSACPRALFTSPVGRGRRAAPGEGLRSRVLEQRPPTPFSAQIDLSPMGRGGPIARTDRFNQNSSPSSWADLRGFPAKHHGAAGFFFALGFATFGGRARLGEPFI